MLKGQVLLSKGTLLLLTRKGNDSVVDFEIHATFSSGVNTEETSSERILLPIVSNLDGGVSHYPLGRTFRQWFFRR